MTTFVNGRVKLVKHPPNEVQEANRTGRNFLLALCIIGMAAIVGFLGLVIFWRSEIEKMQNEVSRIESRTKSECRLIENYRVQRDSLCTWKNIQKKIDLYGLALRPISNEQSVRMTRYNQRPNALAGVAFPGETIATDGMESTVAAKPVVAKKSTPVQGKTTVGKGTSVAERTARNQKAKNARAVPKMKTESGRRVVRNRSKI